jgi:hypothetical protein
MVGVAFALLPAHPAMLFASAMPDRASLGSSVASVKPADCPADRNAAHVRYTLNASPRGEFYAPLDIAPDLLLASDHTVLATGHHRGHEGMRILIETALGSPQQALRTLSARGTHYVALCPLLNEARMYARIAPTDLWQRWSKDMN